MPTAEPIAAVRAFLLADDGIAEIAGANVFSGELDRAENISMPAPVVVVMPAGGPRTIGRSFQQFGDRRIDVVTYGASKKTAWILALAVEAALTGMHQQVSAGVLLFWARPSSQPNYMLDPVTQWPAYLASYQLLASLTT